MATNQLSNMSRKIIPIFIILLLISVFFGKKLLPLGGEFIGGLDVKVQFWWHEVFIKEQFLSGKIPLWNPYYFSGHPFQANPSTFLFYPGKLLFILLPLPWAFNLSTLIHFLIAALGTYFFVFTITKSKYAGLGAAIAYSLSGYFVGRTFAGNVPLVYAAAWIPWVFYFIEKYFIFYKKRSLLLAGFVLGLQILSGDPQLNLYTSLFLTIYFLIRLFSVAGHSESRFSYAWGLFYFIIPIVAFGVAAIQIIPSYEFMAMSQRVSNSYEFSTFVSFPFRNFFTLLVANPVTTRISTNWEYACYIGVITIILAVIGGLFSKFKEYRICAIIICIISVSFMLGCYTPVYKFYLKFIPFLSAFRGPARCIPVFSFFVAVLAGLGIKHLHEVILPRFQFRAIVFMFVILLLCLYFCSEKYAIQLLSKEIILSFLLLATSFIVISLSFLRTCKRIVPFLIIVVLFLDLYFVHSSMIPQLKIDEGPKPYESVFEKDPGLYRVNLPYDLPNRGMSSKFYCINGLTSMYIDGYMEFVHKMADVPLPSEFHRFTFNELLFQSGKLFSSKILGVKYSVIVENGVNRLVKTDKVMPKAVLVKDFVLLPHREDHLPYMKQAGFDPEKTVLLESLPETNTNLTENPFQHIATKSTVVIDQYKPKRIEISLTSDAYQYLVLSELFYPGWHAFIDGKEVKILRANHLLRAIPIKPGHHKILFTYSPFSFMFGAGISLTTILLACSVCLFLVLSRRNRPAD